jgi:hypothetical protein
MGKTTFDYTGITPEDATELRRIAERVKRYLRKVVPVIIELGAELEAAKARLPHGEFGAYCVDECGVDPRSAENYMNLAKLARIHDPADLAKINLKAGYKLAASATPQHVVSEIMADVRAGRSVTEEEVKKRISAAKGKPEPGISTAPDVDAIANILIGSLDPHTIGCVESFLRLAKKALIQALCGRLQQAMNDAAAVASDLLPQNRLA